MSGKLFQQCLSFGETKILFRNAQFHGEHETVTGGLEHFLRRYFHNRAPCSSFIQKFSISCKHNFICQLMKRSKLLVVFYSHFLSYKYSRHSSKERVCIVFMQSRNLTTTKSLCVNKTVYVFTCGQITT